MKILQITAFSGWGCTGRIALGIHNTLEEHGHESAIAWGRINTAPTDVMNIKIGNKIDQKLHGLYTRITDKCGFGSRIETRKFLDKIDEYNPDLIQLHILHGYYINVEILFEYIKMKNIPVVWTFHDCWAFTGHCPYFDFIGCNKWEHGCFKCEQKAHHPKSWMFDNSKENWEKKRKLFTGINNMTIVTPSEWMAKLVEKSFLKECEVKVINNGINLNDFKPIVGDIKQRLKLEGKEIVLGVSSSWVDSKGFKDFVELSRILSSEYKVVLVGLTQQQLEDLPSNIVGLLRTDSVYELAELYTAATVFVNPTYEDNYPTTNLEAYACGTKVITYDTGGSIESVLLNKNGAIVKQGDILSLKNEIEKIDGKTHNNFDMANYNENNKALEYLNLYVSIVTCKQADASKNI